MPNKTWSLMVALSALTACHIDLSEDPADVGADPIEVASDSQAGVVVDPSAPQPQEMPPAITALETDACDDAPHAAEAWLQASSQHMVINFFAGTAADRDQADILAKREAAYDTIRAALGVTAEPVVTEYMSPSRLAASTNGRGFGVSYPANGRIDVIYTGATDSYEYNRYGHEMTHILEPYIDPANPRRHPFLSEGLAEYLDQSGRDMHEAYALQLLAGLETRVRISTLETRDTTAKNYGRAGSFVQLLVERYGMPTFLEVFKKTAVTWTNGCWTNAQVGCINTGEKLTAMLDNALMAVTGEGWSVVQPAWEQKVQAALASADETLPEADVAEIQNLVRVTDLAIARRDAGMYRSTLDGFYCDASGDTSRNDVSQRAVSAMSGTTSKIEAIRPTGIKNFRTAEVFVRRTDERGLASFFSLSVEHTPAGWRTVWGPDWY